MRSTISGMVLDVPVKVGNSVIQANTFNAGTTIATVADMQDMVFRGQIDETEVGKLAPGMPLRITVGALQDKVFNATLEYVSPKSKVENNATLFEIRAAVEVLADVYLRAGYSANAQIILDSRSGVLSLPEGCVRFRQGQGYVEVFTGMDGETQLFEEKNVEVGLSDGISIEVLSGLTEQDQVKGNLQ